MFDHNMNSQEEFSDNLDTFKILCSSLATNWLAIVSENICRILRNSNYGLLDEGSESMFIHSQMRDYDPYVINDIFTCRSYHTHWTLSSP